MKHANRILAASVISLLTLALSGMPALASQPAQPNSDETTPELTVAQQITTDQVKSAYWSYVRVPIANVRACASTRCLIIGARFRGNAVRVYYHWYGWSYIGSGRWIASYLLTR